MALLKEREIVFNILGNGIFLLTPKSCSKGPYQSEDHMIMRRKIIKSTLSLSGFSGVVHELDVPPIPSKILNHVPSRPRKK